MERRADFACASFKGSDATALVVYAEHAELRVVDHANPSNSPKLFRSNAQIAEYLAHLYGQRMTHHVGAALHNVVSGEGRCWSVSSSSNRDDIRLLPPHFRRHIIRTGAESP